MSRAVWLLLAVGLAVGVHAWLGRAPSDAVTDPADPRMHTGDARIVMLAAEWCGYCRKQQGDFERANVRYRVLDVDTPEGDRAMRALGARGVPVTVVGQNVVRGYDTARLDEHLTPLGYRVY
ncbi:glutaredoxin family protein [Cognatilysobacter bugurensis]|uniref:NrdH-redoxin n=1 Tax=Cognatilysobacter bugurensis TaxID=543356 RepID=A0A918T410_9GAMM|nr:glutaredoxin domain-containing protein [Lysobacter bugurensis]GHA90622.1 NrdH-redoxin [Lysobacter bugurensis]